MISEPIRLKPCPAPGTGCHRWLYYAVCSLHHWGVSQTEVEEIIEPRMTRASQCREIANTIAKVYGGTYGGTYGKPCGKLDWLGKADVAKMEVAAREYQGVFKETWTGLSDNASSQEEILKWAFKPDELVCSGNVFDGRWNIVVLTLDQTIASGLNRQFIVPSPFTSYRGVRKDGRATNKSDGQVGFRRFTVVEFDPRGFDRLKALPLEQKLDYQARLHWALSRRFPLALIVFSGNESLHGWYVTRRPEHLMAEAVSIGGDPALWVLSQFTRIQRPSCQRQAPGGRLLEAQSITAILRMNPDNEQPRAEPLRKAKARGWSLLLRQKPSPLSRTRKPHSSWHKVTRRPPVPCSLPACFR